jgi:hypothetical protein
MRYNLTALLADIARKKIHDIIAKTRRHAGEKYPCNSKAARD